MAVLSRRRKRVAENVSRMPTVRRQRLRRVRRADDGERLRGSQEQRGDAKKYCTDDVLFAFHIVISLRSAANMPKGRVKEVESPGLSVVKTTR